MLLLNESQSIVSTAQHRQIDRRTERQTEEWRGWKWKGVTGDLISPSATHPFLVAPLLMYGGVTDCSRLYGV